MFWQITHKNGQQKYIKTNTHKKEVGVHEALNKLKYLGKILNFKKLDFEHKNPEDLIKE